VLLLMGYLFYLLVAAPRREPSPPVGKPVRPA
jgi:hypothetical protein